MEATASAGMPQSRSQQRSAPQAQSSPGQAGSLFRNAAQSSSEACGRRHDGHRVRRGAAPVIDDDVEDVDGLADDGGVGLDCAATCPPIGLLGLLLI